MCYSKWCCTFRRDSCRYCISRLHLERIPSFTFHVSLSPHARSMFDRWCNKNSSWCFSAHNILQHLKSKCYSTVVDRSHYPSRPWHVYDSWFLVSDRKIVLTGDFFFSSTPDYRPVCTADLCGCLSSLQSMGNIFASKNESTQAWLSVASNFWGGSLR